MNQWDNGMPPSGRHDPYAGADAFGPDDDDGTAAYPITWEREPFPAGPPGAFGAAGAPFDRTAGPGSLDDATRRLGLPVGDWPDEDWPPRHRRPGGGLRARWLLPALIVIAGGSAAAGVILTSGHPAAQPGTAMSAPPRPMTPASSPMAPAAQGPLSMAQAAQVLAGYTSANNMANAQRSDTELAAIETGSSYAVDAGIYRTQQAEGAAPYPAFGPQHTQYYIPQETAYPRWFVAQVSNADLASPSKSTGTEYLLFTQAAPGAAWKNTVEPYMVAGAAAPTVALGAGGLATPVTGATSLSVPMGQIAQVTATSLDGSPMNGSSMNGTGALPNPGNLADLEDQAFWQRKLPMSSVTDAHAPDAGTGVFGLRTADGGALLFYTDTAQLTLTAPAGEAMHLTIPGYYSPSQALTRANVSYLEQFAVYDPPAGSPGLRVVADYSGITGT